MKKNANIAGRPEDPDHVRRPDVPQLENRERHQRRGDPRLDHEEQGEAARPPPPSRPSVCADSQPLPFAVDDRVHGEHQRRGDRDGAGDVEAARAPAARHRGQQPQRQDVDRDPDRDVDPEDPVPLEESVRTPPSSTPTLPPPAMQNPKTPIAFARSAGLHEEAHDQRERDRGDDCAAEPLDRARSDSIPSLVETPHRIDAAVKKAIPPRNSRRWPNRSPRRPPSSRKPPKVSR